MANENRFDLEQNIMNCWHVVDDLKMLVKQGDASDENVTAIATLYEQRFQYLWENFENCCANNFEYTTANDYADSMIDRSEEARQKFNEALDKVDASKQTYGVEDA